MSEAQVENWFWEQGIRCIYEPQIVIGDEEFLPDWVLLPQNGIDKPVIIEYWGLCRDDHTLAKWALKKNHAIWIENNSRKVYITEPSIIIMLGFILKS